MGKEIITKALIFAARAHSGQKRKGTDMPYIVHPAEATAIAAGLTDDENVIAAAALHDVVEDAGVTKDMLVGEFGEEVAFLVMQVSEDKMTFMPESQSWRARKQAAIDSLSSCADIRVKQIALADKLSNLRAINRDYKKLGEAFWLRFNNADKNAQLWYYSSITETLKELESTQAFDEYKRLVTETWNCGE